jgi:hypothetical protein
LNRTSPARGAHPDAIVGAPFDDPNDAEIGQPGQRLLEQLVQAVVGADPDVAFVVFQKCAHGVVQHPLSIVRVSMVRRPANERSRQTPAPERRNPHVAAAVGQHLHAQSVGLGRIRGRRQRRRGGIDMFEHRPKTDARIGDPHRALAILGDSVRPVTTRARCVRTPVCP